MNCRNSIRKRGPAAASGALSARWAWNEPTAPRQPAQQRHAKSRADPEAPSHARQQKVHEHRPLREHEQDREPPELQGKAVAHRLIADFAIITSFVDAHDTNRRRRLMLAACGGGARFPPRAFETQSYFAQRTQRVTVFSPP
jgi:hypothetical protein